MSIKQIAITTALAMGIVMTMSEPVSANKQLQNTIGGAVVGGSVGYLVGGRNGATGGAVVGAIAGARKRR